MHFLSFLWKSLKIYWVYKFHFNSDTESTIKRRNLLLTLFFDGVRLKIAVCTCVRRKKLIDRCTCSVRRGSFVRCSWFVLLFHVFEVVDLKLRPGTYVGAFVKQRSTTLRQRLATAHALSFSLDPLRITESNQFETKQKQSQQLIR